MLTNMTLQIVIAARNNIIAISFFKKKTVIWNDTGWETREGSNNSTSYTTLFTSPLILTGTSYSDFSESREEVWRKNGADCYT
jgi:hypothetical protein